jgi:hypothetical protein
LAVDFLQSDAAVCEAPTFKLTRRVCQRSGKETMIYKGACHCGAVRFEVEAPEDILAHDCNCSICAKAGFLHLIVPKSRFRLLSGQDRLTTYSFNTETAKHTFCNTCGIKPFYVPRSNPDGIDINVRCLEPVPTRVTTEPFDGRNWEANAGHLAHLSRDE